MCFTEHLGRWVSDSILPDCTEGQIPAAHGEPGRAWHLCWGARSRSPCLLALTWAPPGPGLGRPSGSLLSSWLLCPEHQGEGDSGPLDHPGCGGHGDREEGVQGAVGSMTLGHRRVWLCPPLHLSLITAPSQTPAFSPLFSIPQVAAKSLWVLEILAPSACNFLPSPPPSSPKAPSWGSGLHRIAALENGASLLIHPPASPPVLGERL